MITLTFRMRKGRIVAFAAVFAIVLGSGMLMRSTARKQALSAQNTTIDSSKISTVAKTEQDRRNFVAAYGWEIADDPLEIREVLIPKEFDQTAEKYNYMQKQQRFDLGKLKGKTVRRYTYCITNYPGGIENVRLNLLVYKNKVVGGDVSTASLDGFMHGFDIASAQTTMSIPDKEAQSTFTQVADQTPSKKAVAKGAYPRD